MVLSTPIGQSPPSRIRSTGGRRNARSWRTCAASVGLTATEAVRRRCREARHRTVRAARRRADGPVPAPRPCRAAAGDHVEHALPADDHRERPRPAPRSPSGSVPTRHGGPVADSCSRAGEMHDQRMIGGSTLHREDPPYSGLVRRHRPPGRRRSRSAWRRVRRRRITRSGALDVGGDEHAALSTGRRGTRVQRRRTRTTRSWRNGRRHEVSGTDRRGMPLRVRRRGTRSPCRRRRPAPDR